MVADMVADMVAGMEVADMEVDIVGDMVATKVFLDQTFLRQSLPRLAHLLNFASLLYLYQPLLQELLPRVEITVHCHSLLKGHYVCWNFFLIARNIASV